MRDCRMIKIMELKRYPKMIVIKKNRVKKIRKCIISNCMVKRSY